MSARTTGNLHRTTRAEYHQRRVVVRAQSWRVLCRDDIKITRVAAVFYLTRSDPAFGSFAKSVFRYDDRAGELNRRVRLRGYDQPEGLKRRGDVNLEIVLDRQFSKIVCLTFGRNGPEDVGRIIGAERLRMTEARHLELDASSPFLSFYFGLSHRLWIQCRAGDVHRGVIVILVSDSKCVALGDDHRFGSLNSSHLNGLGRGVARNRENEQRARK